MAGPEFLQHVVDAVPAEALEKAKDVFHMGQARARRVARLVSEVVSWSAAPAAGKSKAQKKSPPVRKRARTGGKARSRKASKSKAKRKSAAK